MSYSRIPSPCPVPVSHPLVPSLFPIPLTFPGPSLCPTHIFHPHVPPPVLQSHVPFLCPICMSYPCVPFLCPSCMSLPYILAPCPSPAGVSSSSWSLQSKAEICVPAQCAVPCCTMPCHAILQVPRPGRALAAGLDDFQVSKEPGANLHANVLINQGQEEE